LSSIFDVLDPRTFPNTYSFCPIITAIVEEINSGREVPTATIVAPMTNLGILKINPNFSAFSTKEFDDLTKTKILTTRIIIQNKIDSIIH